MSKVQELEDKAFEIYMKNPTWKQRYESAPSDACKAYLRYTFYSSQYYDPEAEDADEFDKLQEEAESKLALEDWEYLKDMIPGSPFVGYCKQKIKELS